MGRPRAEMKREFGSSSQKKKVRNENRYTSSAAAAAAATITHSSAAESVFLTPSHQALKEAGLTP